jgi:outer membrane lipoprotein-sorting protein
MRKILLILFTLPACIALQAQYTGYNQLTDIAKFKNEFSTATQKTLTIKSNFVQEKNLSMLTEKIVSKGKFWFKKDNLVRMEYNQPFQYLMILNKDKVFVKDGQKENKVSARSNKLFQQVNKIMIDCMQGTTLSNPDFKTRVFESKSAYLVELVPIVKGLKDIFKNINVMVDKKDYSVNTIEMQEVSGDNTIIHFVNKELNANLQVTTGDPGNLQKFKPGFSVALYKAGVDVVGNHLSGLLLIKRMPDSTMRMVFSNEIGFKFFDFEFSEGGGFKVFSIIKQMNKKALIKTLRKDFELIMMEGTDPLNVLIRKDEGLIYYTFRQANGYNHYITNLPGNELVRMERSSRRKPVMEAIMKNYKNGIQDTIGITHKNFNFTIGLKRIAR